MRLIGRAALHVLWRISWILAVTLGWVFFGYRSRDSRHTPRSGPVLICSNHQSFFDPIIVGMACYRPMHFFARKTLFKGLFGVLIRIYQAFPVGRGASDPEAIKKAMELLAMDRMVLMFPEGTRTKDGRMQKLRRGVGMLAARSGAPVLPVFLHGAFHIWPRKAKVPRFRRVLRAYVGEPMTFVRAEDETKRSFQERITQEVQEAMFAMERRAFEELPLELPEPVSGETENPESPPPADGRE